MPHTCTTNRHTRTTHAPHAHPKALPLYLISPNCSALTSGALDGRLLEQLSCGLRLVLQGVPLVCATLEPQWWVW